MSSRWDETWHRLLEWTNGQGPSERLAAQVLLADGYTNLDPAHPLGGPDGKRDALANRAGTRQVMAVYFPRGQQTFTDIKKKVIADAEGVRIHHADGLTFVMNQELTVGEREELTRAVQEAVGATLDLFHLERITAILDQPHMASVRLRFGLEHDTQAKTQGYITGGNSFAYLMLYDFDVENAVARNLALIRQGEFPLYNLRFRCRDMDAGRDLLTKEVGDMDAPGDYWLLRWQLPDNAYYRFFFHARNGSWHQDLILQRSAAAQGWLAATRVFGHLNGAHDFDYLDPDFLTEVGPPDWRD